MQLMQAIIAGLTFGSIFAYTGPTAVPDDRARRVRCGGGPDFLLRFAFRTWCSELDSAQSIWRASGSGFLMGFRTSQSLCHRT